jgi:hypothetical protein
MQYITFSCIKVHKRSDKDSQFEPKYVAMTKFIKLVLCMTDLILL